MTDKEIIAEILETMTVPRLRKTDYRWLLRNVRINNSGHPSLEKLIELLKRNVE